MWPYELANEKWLLYPASLKFEGHPDTQCTPTEALNPLKLHSSSPAELPQPVNHRVSRVEFILDSGGEFYFNTTRHTQDYTHYFMGLNSTQSAPTFTAAGVVD